MTAFVDVPHLGRTEHGKKPATKPKPTASTAGGYRGSAGFTGADGARITLSAVKGLTPSKFLTTPFRFQCPPLNELERALVAPWPVFETLSAGERSRPQGAALEVWTIETLFHWDYEPFMVWTGSDASGTPNATNGVFEPQLFIAELKAIAHANVIVRLVLEDPVVWGPKALINSLATLTGVAPKQKPGEVGSEYLTLTVQEFREITLEQQKRRRSQNDHERKVKPKKTDTLADLARHEMGRPSDWRLIAKANGIEGVDSGSASQLQTWLKKHHKTQLVIPATPRHAARPTVRSTSSGKARGT